jgi:predicted nucleotidyltransferase
VLVLVVPNYLKVGQILDYSFPAPLGQVYTVDRLGVVSKLREFFVRRHDGIICAHLYGSMARGEARVSSDIDIAVLFEHDPPPTLDGLGLDLEGELERLLGRPVDLLVLNRAPVDIIHRVLRDGVLVYEGDPSARIRFEVRARNEYFDLLPYLRQYRRAGRGLRS